MSIEETIHFRVASSTKSAWKIYAIEHYGGKVSTMIRTEINKIVDGKYEQQVAPGITHEELEEMMLRNFKQIDLAKHVSIQFARIMQEAQSSEAIDETVRSVELDAPDKDPELEVEQDLGDSFDF